MNKFDFANWHIAIYNAPIFHFLRRPSGLYKTFLLGNYFDARTLASRSGHAKEAISPIAILTSQIMTKEAL
ncbi:hypothetical protein [Lacisediminimonas sp.]|uniref:hypothetical protein n=1 Tax=Lacisediminimonas sp. TaxID=3060582 RepID=UPI00271B3BEA|nr:hypothetical protein [Lacisediminimonas sp.]MDO8298470.1 hypothetical protein [Lacisediminimonas sp.]